MTGKLADVSAGTTAIEIVKVTAPVVGTLGGVWLGFVIERWKRSDDRGAAAEQREREQAAAREDAQRAAIARTMTAAVEWRRDISVAASAFVSTQSAVVLLPQLENSHTAFGEALFSASSLITDRAILDALEEMRQLYEEGFGAMAGLMETSTRPADATVLQAIARDVGDRLSTLQHATRVFAQPGADEPGSR
ncbi:hypothetical protein ACI797_17760 [Geodermatophilus sp. SYSU D00691]